MSEIVCMSPDGRLEVWTRDFGKYHWDVELNSWGSCFTVSYWSWPEFWGREVLGDL